MSTLDYSERLTINNFYNDAGYVLDFSTNEFNVFTMEVIGIPLCEEYKLSKGKSFEAFIKDGDDYQVVNLLNALSEYCENQCQYLLEDEKKRLQFEKCKAVVENFKSKDLNNNLQKTTEKLIVAFDSNYIKMQIDHMNESIDKNPSDAVGKAKELIESCCKTILGEKGIYYDKDWEVPKLTKVTCKSLNLTPEQISDAARGAEIMKKLLGNLSSITHGMSELRNLYAGHGKKSDHVGVTPRHARLAVGSAVTFVQFLWETFEMQKNKK